MLVRLLKLTGVAWLLGTVRAVLPSEPVMKGLKPANARFSDVRQALDQFEMSIEDLAKKLAEYEFPDEMHDLEELTGDYISKLGAGLYDEVVQEITRSHARFNLPFTTVDGYEARVFDLILHHALLADHPERHLPVIDALIAKGVDVNAESHYGLPLMIVALDYNRKVFRRLLRAGADPFKRETAQGTSMHAYDEIIYVGNQDAFHQLVRFDHIKPTVFQPHINWMYAMLSEGHDTLVSTLVRQYDVDVFAYNNQATIYTSEANIWPLIWKSDNGDLATLMYQGMDGLEEEFVRNHFDHAAETDRPLVFRATLLHSSDIDGAIDAIIKHDSVLCAGALIDVIETGEGFKADAPALRYQFGERLHSAASLGPKLSATWSKTPQPGFFKRWFAGWFNRQYSWPDTVASIFVLWVVSRIISKCSKRGYIWMTESAFDKTLSQIELTIQQTNLDQSSIKHLKAAENILIKMNAALLSLQDDVVKRMQALSISCQRGKTGTCACGLCRTCHLITKVTREVKRVQSDLAKKRSKVNIRVRRMVAQLVRDKEQAELRQRQAALKKQRAAQAAAKPAEPPAISPHISVIESEMPKPREVTPRTVYEGFLSAIRDFRRQISEMGERVDAVSAMVLSLSEIDNLNSPKRQDRIGYWFNGEGQVQVKEAQTSMLQLEKAIKQYGYRSIMEHRQAVANQLYDIGAVLARFVSAVEIELKQLEVMSDDALRSRFQISAGAGAAQSHSVPVAKPIKPRRRTPSPVLETPAADPTPVHERDAIPVYNILLRMMKGVAFEGDLSSDNIVREFSLRYRIACQLRAEIEVSRRPQVVKLRNLCAHMPTVFDKFPIDALQAMADNVFGEGVNGYFSSFLVHQFSMTVPGFEAYKTSPEAFYKGESDARDYNRCKGEAYIKERIARRIEWVGVLAESMDNSSEAWNAMKMLLSDIGELSKSIGLRGEAWQACQRLRNGVWHDKIETETIVDGPDLLWVPTRDDENGVIISTLIQLLKCDRTYFDAVNLVEDYSTPSL